MNGLGYADDLKLCGVCGEYGTLGAMVQDGLSWKHEHCACYYDGPEDGAIAVLPLRRRTRYSGTADVIDFWDWHEAGD